MQTPLMTGRKAKRRAAATIATIAVLGLVATAALPEDQTITTSAASEIEEAPSPASVVAAGQDVEEAGIPGLLGANEAGLDEFVEAERAAMIEFEATRTAEQAAEQAAAEQAAAEAAAAEQAAAEQAAAEQAAAEQAAAEQAAAEQAAAEQAAAEQAAAEAAAAEAAAAEAAAAEQAAAEEAARGSHWDRLADCESGDWDANGTPIAGSARWNYGISFSHGDHFEGGLNFHPATWESYRSGDMAGHAGNASRSQQIAVAEQVQADQGWGAWPVCSRKVGLR